MLGDNFSIINDDCMNILSKYEDDYFDLAIVDPPYGFGNNSGIHAKGGGKLKNRILNKNANKFIKWDKKPSKEYFNELFRVSKNQIIWGGNYFDLPPYRCVIVWDKCQPFPNFSAVEIAWTSFEKPASLYKYDNRKKGKIHPTQKPRELYSWLLEKYSQQSDKILDTHLGSGSSAIACHNFGTEEFVGIEIDKEYYDMANKRIEEETKQIKLL
tara:strand:- start:4569 stop:5207 length:639 start_codon:yes stop_codon:yes gene_type:complete